VREILARGAATSQEDLQRALAARGIHAAQPTISRDLAALGAGRVAAPGGAHYRLEPSDGALPIEPVRRLVDAVTTNGMLVVVRTKAGAASTVARALDDARLDEILGTIAGDDTIFVAPRQARAATTLARQLRALLSV